MSDRHTCHFYVDEAGDPTLYDRHGQVIIGTEGCSRTFIMGAAEVQDPPSLRSALEKLRAELIADPYFAGVPSFHPNRGRTAHQFHAKDDPAEVRREVFAVLQAQSITFSAVVRDKAEALRQVQAHQGRFPHYRYNHNHLYDNLVGLLLGGRTHGADAYRVTFATRGASDRTRALTRALTKARHHFAQREGISVDSVATVHNIPARDEPCIQATDYLLWAVQRFYERSEPRFLKLIWPVCQEIVDVDGYAQGRNGNPFGMGLPLTLEDIAEPEI